MQRFESADIPRSGLFGRRLVRRLRRKPRRLLRPRSRRPDRAMADAGVVLRTLLEAASGDWSRHSPGIRDGVQAVQGDVSYLLGRWEAATNRPVPLRYVESLQADTDVLRGARASAPLPPPREKQVLETFDDVRLKAAQCRQSQGAWAGLVTVQVRTVDAAQRPATGKEVWYCPRGWADVDAKWLKFPTLSTPTDERLPPGVYMFRVGRGEPEARRIGGDGQPTASIELIARP